MPSKHDFRDIKRAWLGFEHTAVSRTKLSAGATATLARAIVECAVFFICYEPGAYSFIVSTSS